MTPVPFSGPSVNSYAEGAPRQVPGLFGLHRMTTMLLREAGLSDVSLFDAGFSF